MAVMKSKLNFHLIIKDTSPPRKVRNQEQQSQYEKMFSGSFKTSKGEGGHTV